MEREESTAQFAALAGQEEAARSEQPARPAQTDEAETVARGYFSALERGERTAQRDWYHPEMEGTVHGVVGWRARGTFAGPGRFDGMALERAAAA
jgi:hypothetical protein